MLKHDSSLSVAALESVFIFGSVFRHNYYRPYPPFAILDILMPEPEIAKSTFSTILEGF